MELGVTASAIYGTLGFGRTLFEERLAAGLIPQPLPRPAKGPGERLRLWPKSEIEILVRATFAGYTDDQIRELVERLMERRKEKAAELQQLVAA